MDLPGEERTEGLRCGNGNGLRLPAPEADDASTRLEESSEVLTTEPRRRARAIFVAERTLPQPVEEPAYLRDGRVQRGAGRFEADDQRRSVG